MQPKASGRHVVLVVLLGTYIGVKASYQGPRVLHLFLFTSFPSRLSVLLLLHIYLRGRTFLLPKASHSRQIFDRLVILTIMADMERFGALLFPSDGTISPAEKTLDADYFT